MTYQERQQFPHPQYWVRVGKQADGWFDPVWSFNGQYGTQVTTLAEMQAHIKAEYVLPEALLQLKAGATLETEWGEIVAVPTFYTSFGVDADQSRWSHTTLLQVLEQPEIKLISAEFSDNSYGEFIFLYLYDTVIKKGLSLYGHGWHERRSMYLADWTLVDSMLQTPLNLYNPLHRANEEFEQLLRENPIPAKLIRTQGRDEQIFNFLADLTDEDGALTEMEDFNFGEFFDDE